MSGLQYIRDYYRVPAEVGGRIKYTGGKGPQMGTITGVEGAYLLIQLDGQAWVRPYHPTWELEYIA